MADCTNNRSGRGRDGSNEVFIAERQEILQRAATAGEDNDIHVGVGIQFL